MRRTRTLLIASTGVALSLTAATVFFSVSSVQQRALCFAYPLMGLLGLGVSSECDGIATVHALPAATAESDPRAPNVGVNPDGHAEELDGSSGDKVQAGHHASGSVEDSGHGTGGVTAEGTSADLDEESLALIRSVASASRSGVTGEVHKLLDAQTSLGGRWIEPTLNQREQLLAIDAEIDNLQLDRVNEQIAESLSLAVLSGAPPNRIKKLVDSSDVGKPFKSLIALAAVHALGNRKADKSEFRAVEELPLSRPLLARLALAEAQQVGSADAEKIVLLRRAAEITPGSLLEEAAIRRIIVQAALSSRSKEFAYWADRYARRFAGSAYFDEYELGLSTGILMLARQKKPLSKSSVARIMLRLPKPVAVSILERISSGAVVEGLADLCLFSSALGKRLSSPRDPAYIRLSLNRLACSVTTWPQETLAELRRVSPELLDSDGQTLLRDATALAEAILSKTTKPSIPQPGSGEVDLHSMGKAADVQDFEASVAQQLDDTSQVLMKGRQ